MTRVGVTVLGDAAFHSILALIPAKNVGIFFSITSSGSGIGPNITQQFLMDSFDRWFPSSSEVAVSATAVKAGLGNAECFAGAYLPNRRMSSGILGLAYWSLTNVRVTVTSDRAVGMRGLFLDMELVEVELLLFAETEGRLMVAFAEDDRGVIRSMYHDDFPAMAYEKLRPTETPGFLAVLAVLR